MNTATLPDVTGHPVRPWDITEYNQPHLPLAIGHVEPDPRTDFEPVRVLDMPISDNGSLALPFDIARYAPIILAATRWERATCAWGHQPAPRYTYLTVDEKPVQPGVSQRRPGCHADAWMSSEDGTQLDVTAETLADQPPQQLVERTYVWYDALPTEFFPGPFPITGLTTTSGDPERRCDPILAEFDRIAATQDPVTYPCGTLLCLDPYDVHRSAFNTTDRPVLRTFVKIAFSDRPYNRAGNTPNPMLPMPWSMVPRRPELRAHRWAAA